MKSWSRYILALIILVVLVLWAGIDSVIAQLSDFRPEYLLPLSLLTFLLILISCLKWRLFIRVFIQAQGNDVSIRSLLRLYIIGYFFNLFTPSFIGGDVARSYKLGKQIGTQADAFVATFLERFTGLLAMVLLAFGAVLFGTSVTKGVELTVIVGTAVAVGATLVCFSEVGAALALRVGERLLDSSVSLLGDKFVQRSRSILQRLHLAFAGARQNKRLIVPALAWSFAFHVCAVLNTYVAAKAIGWEDPSFSGMFVATPLALLVGVIPLTPSGLGLQEGAFVFFLERIGGDRSQGVLVAFVLRIKAVLVGLLGGYFLWRDSLTPPPQRRAVPPVVD